MEIINLYPGSLGANCYILFAGNEAMAVDPAVSAKAILTAVAQRGATLTGILLTHGHFDHMLSLDTLRERSGVPAYIHENDAKMLTDGTLNAFSFFFKNERVWRAAERLLKDGDKLILGGEEITLLHTPGHTEGSSCFAFGDSLLTGDTLFFDNIGRSDLPGGDENALRRSLSRLRTLSPDTVIYPGHGDKARLGDALDRAKYFFDLI